MLNVKSISVITLALSLSAIAGSSSAQTSALALQNATQPAVITKSVQAPRQVMPVGMKVRKITRVVKPVPVLANATQPQPNSIYRGVINATTSEPKAKTRFVYNRNAVETQMPVYFSEDALKSK